MGFCKKCGSEVAEDARFCEKCGTPVNQQGSSAQAVKMQPDSGARKQSYEGEIRKCPNCGDPIDAFELVCDKCGYNFSTNRMSTSQERLAAQLSAIDAEMQEAKKKSRKDDTEWAIPYKERKATCINAFPVANSVEEIASFLMYAGGNIDMSCVATSNSNNNYDKGDHMIADAWIGKMDQMYQMAKVSFADSPKFTQIEHIYTEKKKEIKKTRVKKIVSNPLFLSGAMMVGGILMLLMMPLFMGGGERKLERQVKQIEAYIAEENYDAALTTAYAMSDNYSDSWSETRASLINRILELQGKSQGIEENHEGMVQIPIETLTGKQVSDVVAMLTSAGFTNVTQEKVQSDLLTGWMDKMLETKGEVEEVSVNGSTDYTKGSWLAPDTPIIVRHW